MDRAAATLSCSGGRRSGSGWRRRSAPRWCSTSSMEIPRSGCISATSWIGTPERCATSATRSSSTTSRRCGRPIAVDPARGRGARRASHRVRRRRGSRGRVAHRAVPGGDTDHAPRRRRTPSGDVEILSARASTTCAIDVHLPLGVLTCVTGVPGSGKSTLVNALPGDRQPPAQCAPARTASPRHQGPGPARQDHRGRPQSPIGRTPRSNPATYTGLFGRHPR